MFSDCSAIFIALKCETVVLKSETADHPSFVSDLNVKVAGVGNSIRWRLGSCVPARSSHPAPRGPGSAYRGRGGRCGDSIEPQSSYALPSYPAIQAASADFVAAPLETRT